MAVGRPTSRQHRKAGTPHPPRSRSPFPASPKWCHRGQSENLHPPPAPRVCALYTWRRPSRKLKDKGRRNEKYVCIATAAVSCVTIRSNNSNMVMQTQQRLTCQVTGDGCNCSMEAPCAAHSRAGGGNSILS